MKTGDLTRNGWLIVLWMTAVLTQSLSLFLLESTSPVLMASVGVEYILRTIMSVQGMPVVIGIGHLLFMPTPRRLNKTRTGKKLRQKHVPWFRRKQ
jgi:hypothetical protein